MDSLKLNWKSEYILILIAPSPVQTEWHMKLFTALLMIIWPGPGCRNHEPRVKLVSEVWSECDLENCPPVPPTLLHTPEKADSEAWVMSSSFDKMWA